MNLVEVTGKTKDGSDITVYVKRPTAKDQQEAKLHSNRIAASIINQKTPDGKPAFILRSQIFPLLKEQGLWNEKLEDELIEVSKKISEGELTLSKGGIKKSEAKKLAIQMRDWRARQLEILSKSREMDQFTLEAQCENHNFNYLITKCILNEEGEQIFDDVDTYSNSEDHEPYVFLAAQKLAEMMYGLDEDRVKEYPENQFMVKYGFCNEKLQYINKDGQLVDELGRRVNDDGYLINDAGEIINEQGERIDSEGNVIVEFTEFLDD